MEMKETKTNTDMVIADELAGKGHKAFLSYTWKLNKSHDDSYDSSEAIQMISWLTISHSQNTIWN